MNLAVVFLLACSCVSANPMSQSLESEIEVFTEEAKLANEKKECCEILSVSATGPAKEAAGLVLGKYTIAGEYNHYPIYKLGDTDFFVFVNDQFTWVVDERVGGRTAILWTESGEVCVTDTGKTWQYEDGTQWANDPSISVQCDNTIP